MLKSQRWKLVQRCVLIGFFILISVLIMSLARSVDWPAVVKTLKSYDYSVSVAALCLAALSYLLCGSYDILSGIYTGHTLPRRQVMTVAFISYAFNYNFGMLIGGAGLRFRLYSRLGLTKESIARILSMSLVTNWMGYLCLAGLLFSLRLLTLPVNVDLGQGALQLLGILFFAIPLTYVLLCAFSKRRTWAIRGHDITLPSIRMAMMQLLLSMTNWLTMGLIIFLFLRQEIAFPMVLGTLLIGAFAGIISRIPAGLGVLEAVFVVFLQYQVPPTDIIAAILAYRTSYHFLPLLLAGLTYLVIELRSASRLGSYIKN